MSKRPYRLKRRAEQQEETRQRIVEAIVDLHGRIGPARTTISAIAEQAGVERLTVYRHFPNEAAIFSACSAHYSRLNPLPDPEAWREIADPVARLRTALSALYAYYRTTEPMISHILRDAHQVPAVQEALVPFLSYMQGVANLLREGWNTEGERATLLAAAINHAIDFSAWQSLAGAGEGRLSREQAVELMARFVEAAAREATT